MERPKARAELVKREVTGEIVYLNTMRELGQAPETYPDDIPDVDLQMYEAKAGLYQSRGDRPGIMDAYEKYEKEISEDLGASCAGLADELLKHKDPESPLTYEDFIVSTPATEVLESLKKLRAGELLAADDEQLAVLSGGEYYPVLDIKKQNSRLLDVTIRVSGWSDVKYLFTNKPGEQRQYPQDYLRYPSNEKSHWYELDLIFSYEYPDSDSGYFNETVSLYIGQRGDLSLSSDIWAATYAETGYEGHGGKSLDGRSDEDVAAFADLIAKLVGDEPETIGHFNLKVLARYIDKVASEQSRVYLGEWLLNSHAAQVSYDLEATSVGDQSLLKALLDPEHATEAHKVLVENVDEMRQSRNELAADTERTALYGTKLEPWHDIAVREA